VKGVTGAVVDRKSNLRPQYQKFGPRCGHEMRCPSPWRALAQRSIITPHQT